MIENPLLIFDLGNVLLRFDNDYFLEQVAKACPDPKKAVSVIKAYWAGPVCRYWERYGRRFFPCRM